METEETLLKIGEKEHNIWKAKTEDVSGRKERLATINAAKKVTDGQIWGHENCWSPG